MHAESNSSPLSNAEEEETTEIANEVSKLKGILWPGMNIFDSATAEQQRKRNQKKAVSVAVRLERYAADVEPIETIWTPWGSFYKERPITGKVDFDSSPYKLDALSPDPQAKSKKRKSAAPGSRTKRVPLAEKDVNTTLRRGKQVVVTPAAAEMLALDPKPAANPTKKRNKKKFDVLDERQQEQPFGNPSGMRYLTSEFRHGPLLGHQQMQPHYAFDNNYAAYYQPAMHRGGHFQQGYNPMPQQGYDMQYYGPLSYSNNNNAFDLPGFFSYPTQQHNFDDDLAPHLSIEENDRGDQACDVKVLTGMTSQPASQES